jgi:predicted AAA+ superfamily ATPase
METLLEEFYKQDLHTGHFVDRKIQLDDESCQINGISQCGKTMLIKHYLLSKRKSSYLYIDCDDVRIDEDELNKTLASFCNRHEIATLALDNYRPAVKTPKVTQLITASVVRYPMGGMKSIKLFPLDFEEFLAYEHKFDSTALNHFFHLGGFPAMHRIASEERSRYIQTTLQHALNSVEFDLMVIAARMTAQKVSAFMLYERLRSERKISKDMLYKNMDRLIQNGYLHQLAKYDHPRATKKLFLCDITVKNALTTEKHFGRLFENLVYLEMLKRGFELYCDEGIDFYLPLQRRVVLCMPFGNQEMLFKKIESIEGFIITNNIAHVEVVTMGTESSLRHPFVTAEMIPFANWALMEGE